MGFNSNGISTKPAHTGSIYMIFWGGEYPLSAKKGWMLESTHKRSAKVWPQAFILPLLLAVMSVAWSSSPLFAEEGRAYPDTAQVALSFEMAADTVTVTIRNLSAQPVDNLVLADFATAGNELISCTVDGFPSTPTILSDSGLVFSDRFSTRWLVGSFSDNARITYLSFSTSMYFTAGHPYPVFGVVPAIGPVRSLQWQQ